MKKFMSNTILFVGILVFIKMFEIAFGSSNTLVGVTVIISILVLARENLIENPVGNFMNLLLANAALGIFAHISSHNMWAGLLLNFIALFCIGYVLSFRLDKSIVVPFGLQYLFMLYTPVAGIDFTKRILGLGIGAVLIMIVQFAIYMKNKDAKSNDYESSGCYNDCMYRDLKLLGKTFKIHETRAAYAVRIGLIIAITAFVVDFFNLQQGRWIVYTVFSLTELYSENCIIRSKERLQGTIIGSLITLVLFMCIEQNVLRGLIVLAGGYLDTYSKNYKDKMICVTISVVASMSLINGTIVTAVERIGYVSVGIVFALIANMIVFKKQMGDFEVAK